MGIIYVATNRVNGKQYVGQTRRTLKQRIKDHLRERRSFMRVFHRALVKYGVDSFDFEERLVSDDMLDQEERRLILELNTKVPNGYNLTDGGGGSKGYKHTDETKKKCSIASKGRIFSEEHKRRIALGRTGWRHTEETKQMISQNNKGKKWGPWTAEHFKNSKLAQAKRVRKRYIFVDPNGVDHLSTRGFEVFCSEHGLCERNMHDVLRGKYKKHKGWFVRHCEQSHSLVG